MKKFNLKLITLLILTLMLQSCMPDSLTKFKKETPKKVVPPLASPITDNEGKAVDPATINFPTKFFYLLETATPVVPLTVGTAATIAATVDGTLADSTKRDYIFVRCELDQTGTIRSRVAPPGMQFDTTTCNFSGTPISVYSENDIAANIGQPITYKINLYYKDTNYYGPGTEAKLSTQIKMASYLKPADMVYSQNDRLVLKTSVAGGALSNITTNSNEAVDYVRTGVITSASGVSGIVKFVDTTTSQIALIKVIPLTVSSVASFNVNGYVSAAGGKKGKVLKKDSTNNILYVETLSSNAYFAVGNGIDNVAAYLSTKATITSIASDHHFQNTTATRSLDNDFQYYSNEFSLNSVVQTYEVNSVITSIVPISSSSINTANGIVYSISPALPNADVNNPDLIFNTATGVISGKFTAVFSPTVFTITATNLLGSTTSKIELQAIQSPQSLSYTTKELITVSSFASFLENEALFQPITPPLTASIKGRIIRKVGTNQLNIDTQNGAFLSGAYLDSGRSYYSAKAYIDPLSAAPAVNYNLALKVGSTAGIALGSTITGGTSAATARVMAIGADDDDDSLILTPVLYVQLLAPSSPVNTFIQGEAIGATTITQIESNTMKLGFALAPGYSAGQDITTSVSALSGYIYDVSGTSVSVSDIVKKAKATYFFNGQIVANNERFGDPTAIPATISTITHDNFYIVERGVPFEIQMNLAQGTGVIYSVSTPLPPGITLNTTTGKISGTATSSYPRKDYIITAKNLLGSSNFVLPLEVRGYFKIGEESGAPSFNMHKFGDNEHYRDCKINEGDIIGSTGVLDVRCYLDAEEEDLHFTPLKLTAQIGAGACEYIQFVPFSFYQYEPFQTGTIDTPVDVLDITGDACSGKVNTEVTTVDNCAGKWEDGPNCDEGAFRVTTENAAPDGSGGCSINTTITILKCGGAPTNCMVGPIRDVLADTEIKKGNRSMVYSMVNGGKLSWPLTSPSEELDLTNLRVANGTVNNRCTTSNSDANDLQTRLAGVSPLTQPFGSASPYYTFNCLDAAREIKARIRLSVREWDRSFKINSNLDANIPALMNDSSLSPFGKSYDDFLDWDGDYNSDPAKGVVDYNGGTCAAPAIANDYEFPRDDI